MNNKREESCNVHSMSMFILNQLDKDSAYHSSKSIQNKINKKREIKKHGMNVEENNVKVEDVVTERVQLQHQRLILIMVL